MATGGFNPVCVVPVCSSISVGTSAVQVKTSSTLAVKFALSNPGTLAIYIGGSNVASNLFMIKLAAGSTQIFGPEELVGGRQKISYDLAGIYLRASAASQAAILTLYSKGGSNGPF